MSSDRRTDRERLRDALGPGQDCLSIEDLERCLSGSATGAPVANLAAHLAACPHCRAELDLLREFQSGAVREDEAELVRAVTRQLRTRAPEIYGRGRELPLQRDPWWKALLGARWLSPAALAMAAILVAFGISLQLRRGEAPLLHSSQGPGQEVMRSSSLTLLAPIGDLTEAPKEIQWRPVPGAVEYKVRLLEVDQAELWKAATSASRIELPPAARRLAVPGKTILCEVTAFDARAKQIAGSELLRFRVMPHN